MNKYHGSQNQNKYLQIIICLTADIKPAPHISVKQSPITTSKRKEVIQCNCICGSNVEPLNILSRDWRWQAFIYQYVKPPSA